MLIRSIFLSVQGMLWIAVALFNVSSSITVALYMGWEVGAVAIINENIRKPADVILEHSLPNDQLPSTSSNCASDMTCIVKWPDYSDHLTSDQMTRSTNKLVLSWKLAIVFFWLDLCAVPLISKLLALPKSLSLCMDTSHSKISKKIIFELRHL